VDGLNVFPSSVVRSSLVVAEKRTSGGRASMSAFDPNVRSLTLYNDKRLFHANDLNRYSLGTKNKDLKRHADGSLTLSACAKPPASDKEANLLPAPNGHFPIYIRAYWGKEGILERRPCCLATAAGDWVFRHGGGARSQRRLQRPSLCVEGHFVGLVGFRHSPRSPMTSFHSDRRDLL
jgi:hypothetical protein